MEAPASLKVPLPESIEFWCFTTFKPETFNSITPGPAGASEIESSLRKILYVIREEVVAELEWEDVNVIIV